MPNPIAFEDEMAGEKVKRHKAPGAGQIPAYFIKTRLENFALRFINLLILFGVRRNCLSRGRSRSLCLAIRRLIKHYNFYKGISLLRTMYKIFPTFCCQF
jgi:hypothetical protein